jgi:RNA polymerase sigma-70 factor (ECF subfamily)
MATHDTKADRGLDVAACLARVRRGDDEAARQLVGHLYPLVLRIARAHRPRRVAEEDLAQDIFLKVFSRLDQYRGGVPFEHWVARIAVTTCLDQLRAQKRRPELRWADLSESEAQALESVTATAEEPHPAAALSAREIVRKLLDCLSPQDRLVVTMLDLEERSLAEIRKMTGWNETLIKVRAFRARRKLRKHLADLEKGRLR